MEWQELPARTRLLLSYWYFDFSVTRWEETLLSGKENPYENLALVNLRPSVSPPRHWEAALETPFMEHAIAYFDSDYPPALTELGDRRPPVIYIRGSRAIPSLESLVAIVGTRNPSFVGRRNAEAFACTTAGKGFGVVSGLARGIDSIAHRYSLTPYTLAVLGSGVNSIYPRGNTQLAETIIASGGTILSPFPDTQIIQQSNFPRRNLLIAALSAGTIVIEGAEISGANVTGRLSLELSRPTVALTQDFRTSAGRGAIKLLWNGATATLDPADALRIIAAETPEGLLPLVKGHKVIPPPSEFTLDEWIDRYGDAPRALRELEARVHSGSVVPLGSGIYRSNA